MREQFLETPKAGLNSGVNIFEVININGKKCSGCRIFTQQREKQFQCIIFKTKSNYNYYLSNNFFTK